jgi:hypothetical protein
MKRFNHRGTENTENGKKVNGIGVAVNPSHPFVVLRVLCVSVVNPFL